MARSAITWGVGSSYFVVAVDVFKPDGQISGHLDVSRQFCIKAGVRQGCVLSPRLFCSLLQLPMEDLRTFGTPFQANRSTF